MDEVVEGKRCPIPSELTAELHEYARVARELRCDIDYERGKRRCLEESVSQLEFDHGKSRQTMLLHCWRMNGNFIF